MVSVVPAVFVVASVTVLAVFVFVVRAGTIVVLWTICSTKV